MRLRPRASKAIETVRAGGCAAWIALAGCQSLPAPAPSAETALASAVAEPAAGPLEQRLLALAGERSDDGVVLYALARVAAANGRPTAAIEALDRLAAARWSGGVQTEDFPTLADDPGFVRRAARFLSRERRVANAREAFAFVSPRLDPEGSAWDAKRQELLLSSGGRRQVVALDAAGHEREVVARGQDGLLAVLGMEVDSRHDLLWMATAASPEMHGYDPADSGRSALVAIRLDNEQTGPLGAIAATIAAPTAPALLNDVVVAGDGSVYVTDSDANRVYRLAPGAGQLVPVTAAEAVWAPNGIALSADGGALYVADFLGLSRLDLTSRELFRLAPPAGVDSLGGIDGLESIPGGLVGIQNVAGRGRVWRVDLTVDGRGIAGATLIEAGNPRFANPTTGAIVDDELWFVANPQAERRPPERGGGAYTVLRLPVRPVTNGAER